jgi:hypothetical protein
MNAGNRGEDAMNKVNIAEKLSQITADGYPLDSGSPNI